MISCIKEKYKAFSLKKVCDIFTYVEFFLEGFGVGSVREFDGQKLGLFFSVGKVCLHAPYESSVITWKTINASTN